MHHPVFTSLAVKADKRRSFHLWICCVGYFGAICTISVLSHCVDDG